MSERLRAKRVAVSSSRSRAESACSLALAVRVLMANETTKRPMKVTKYSLSLTTKVK